jgi:single-stranded-DNA-specific exonuclease
MHRNDGALEHAEMTLDVARLLDEQVWGRAPQFNNDFAVQNQCVVGEKHLKLRLSARENLWSHTVRAQRAAANKYASCTA